MLKFTKSGKEGQNMVLSGILSQAISNFHSCSCASQNSLITTICRRMLIDARFGEQWICTEEISIISRLWGILEKHRCRYKVFTNWLDASWCQSRIGYMFDQLQQFVFEYPSELLCVGMNGQDRALTLRPPSIVPVSVQWSLHPFNAHILDEQYPNEGVTTVPRISTILSLFINPQSEIAVCNL